MVGGNIIVVKTRKEFIKLLRELFIPETSKDGTIIGFNIGYAINNWTSFWLEDGTTVNLES